MATTKVFTNIQVSAPFATSATKITAATSSAQLEVTITAPLDITATLAVQEELSANGVDGWTVKSSLIGARGGTGKDGVSPAKYVWAAGVSPDFIGQFVRLNFTVVTGTWTLDASLTV